MGTLTGVAWNTLGTLTGSLKGTRNFVIVLLIINLTHSIFLN